MSALSERAARIAEQARAKTQTQARAPERLDVARQWWLITTPAGKTVEVSMHPPATEREIRAIYPGCRVEAV